ncbi:hypothetical protein [Amycolatopsis kentuckyensis]|uniref:hypothetical protein n=1 Tax=Amycolatopsis kentuckyensis TaxID=218823 RepID=UPI0035615671
MTTTSRIAAARMAWAGGVLIASRYVPVPRKAAVVLAVRHLAQGAATLRRPDGVRAARNRTGKRR